MEQQKDAKEDTVKVRLRIRDIKKQGLASRAADFVLHLDQKTLTPKIWGDDIERVYGMGAIKYNKPYPVQVMTC